MTIITNNNYYDEKGRRYVFEYTPTDDFSDIEPHLIRQVRAVTYCPEIGKFAIVRSGPDRGWGHPGGTLESGETIEQALERELIEETNTCVIWCKPLGYQKVTEESGRYHYGVRYVAIVQQIGNFVSDPDNPIAECMFVPRGQVLDYVKWGQIGDEIFSAATYYFDKWFE